MKNKEKYAKEIIEIVCDGRILGVNKVTGKPTVCGNISCKNCLRYDRRNNCSGEVLREWAESEYIEKPVISKMDRAFLEYIEEEFIYIARNEDERLFLFANKAVKMDEFGVFTCEGLYTRALYAFNIDFPMVKWEDGEPWLIEDLKKLEVVEEYE